MKPYSLGEKGVQYILTAVAFSALFGLLLIALFILKEGLPFLVQVGLKDFIFAHDWEPQSGQFGIYPMIIASLWVTFGAMLIGAPLGIACAVFLTEFVPRPVMHTIKPMIELLAGIPSVLYGFIGVIVLAPLIRTHLGGPGLSLLAASIILGIMVLPTIIQTSLAAINAVPNSYYEGSLALGATHESSVFRAIVPAARSGIVSGIVLGIGRAIGETTAIIMVAGNNPRMPGDLLKGVRTLTVNVLMEMGYAADLHRESLIATGVVLFVIVMAVNFLFSFINRRRVVQ